MDDFEDILTIIANRMEHLDNTCVNFLTKNSKDYQETKKRISEINTNHVIEGFFTTSSNSNIIISSDEHTLLLELLELYNHIFVLESYFAYLQGCKDASLFITTMQQIDNGL